MNKKLILSFLSLFLFLSATAQISLVSWNIRDFGQTKDESEISKIADIVKDYDIVALQEVVAGYGGPQAVAKLADELNRKGAKWDYVISPPTKSPAYKTERYAFLWKTHRVKALGRGRLIKELQNAVYREPFLMTFKYGDKIFHILNYHSKKHIEHPETEVDDIVNYLIRHSDKTLILAGDFNLSETHKVFDELYTAGYQPAVYNSKTTLKTKCKAGVYLNHAIDNIYIPVRKLSILQGRTLDFVKNCQNLSASRFISDHIPVSVRFSWY